MEHAVIFVLLKRSYKQCYLLLYLHDFYNMVFKIKHKLHIASGLPTHPQ